MKKNPIFIKFKFYGFAVLALCFLCFASCDFYECLENKESEIVDIFLPDWPEYLPSVDFWLIKIERGDFSTCEFSLLPDKNCFTVELNKNMPVSILAYPVIKNDFGKDVFFYKPAGNIYPASFEKKSINLTWNNGYGAYILAHLFVTAKSSGYSLEYINEFAGRFNWEKFMETVNQKVENSEKLFYDSQNSDRAVFYNPWILSVEEVLQSIAYDDFTATKLNISNIVSEQFEFTVFSSFIPENKIINEFGLVTLKKNDINFFSLSQTYGIIVDTTSGKNISLKVISMPILE